MQEEVKNLESVNIERMLKGLSTLAQEPRKPIDNTYQEYQRASIDSLKPAFMNAIKTLYQQSAHSKFLNNIVTNHSKYFSCLLAYSEQIGDVIDEGGMFAFSHKGFVSQSALLAFLLAKRTGSTVTLVAAEESLLRQGHLIAGEAEEDKLSFVRATMQKEGVALHDLKEWNKQSTVPENHFAIIDVFGMSPVEYSPFLLHSAWRKGVVYHSHLQNEEIAKLLNAVNRPFLPIQLSTEHPTETQTAKNQTALLGQLLEFLQEDRAHPQKQDAVIFFPVETHPKKFAARLGEMLSKAGLRDHINVVTKAHQKQPRSKNNVFLVQGTEQLLKWNYDYANVVYVVDYGRESHIIFNYQRCAFEDFTCAVSPLERAKRQSLIGDSHFGIYSSLSQPELYRIDQFNNAKDISIYLMKMIDYGLQSHLDLSNKRITDCLALLQRLNVLKKEQLKYSVIDEQIISLAKQGVSPIQSRFILNLLNSKLPDKQSVKAATLAIFMVICLHTKENIRKHKHQQGKIRSKPTQFWRKGGYIESCVAIIAQCEATELYLSRQSESQAFRRTSSKMQENENDPFGSFYQLIQNGDGGIEGERRSVPTFLQENSIDEDIFYRIREEIDHYRDIFSVPKISVLSETDYFRIVLKQYVNLFKQTLLFYSGYIRKGYRNEKGQEYIQINPQYLKKYPVKPHFISAMRYISRQNGKEIFHWNTVQETDYIEAMGGIPILQKLSKQQTEIEFHGISSLQFQRLWRNNGAQISQFQEEYSCFVEANNEMALVSVHCERQRQAQIKEKFQVILSRVKANIQASKRLTNYFGNIKFYMGAGGAIKELVIGEYVSKALVENLHLDVTKEDLEELIEQFLIVRDINICLPEPGQNTKSAIVFFNSQRDYYTFFEYFNECEYFGYHLRISPMRRSKAEFAWERQYIQFRWYVWQSHCKALIRFTDKCASLKAHEAFINNPTLDGTKVNVKVDEKVLYIDELNQLTDQSFLEQVFKEFGKIEQVEILKTPLRDGANDALQLQNLVKGSIQNTNFTMEKIERGKNGQRSCMVRFQDSDNLMKVVAQHNRSVGKLGVSRLYASPHFQRSMQIPDSLRSVALAILEELLDHYQSLNLAKGHLLKHDVIGEQIIFRSSDKQYLDSFYTALSARMKGTVVKLRKSQKSLLFNQIGLANVMDLQEKYDCKIMVNMAIQNLTLISKAKMAQTITKEITTRIVSSFFYKIHLNSKSYRHLRAHPHITAEVKEKYKLKLVQLQSDQQSIIIEGGILAVQNANTYFMFLIESINQPEQSRVHSDVCGICCEQPKNSYRFQNCFHRFCLQCFQQYIRSVLGDASQFPIKCPHCMELIIIEDLHLLLDKGQWQKCETLGINRFMNDNSDKMRFCYTAGCKQINFLDGPVYSCDTCKFSYCNKCKEVVHPGFSCDQAIEIRQTDAYFLKYMAENGIRKCPNSNCGMPVVKIDGCNKVLCTRCGKSMCFKCPPELMIPYDTPQQAYDHLNAKHGGYW